MKNLFNEILALGLKWQPIIFISLLCMSLVDADFTNANSPQSFMYWIGLVFSIVVIYAYIKGIRVVVKCIIDAPFSNRGIERIVLVIAIMGNWFFGLFASAPLIAFVHNLLFDPLLGLGSDQFLKMMYFGSLAVYTVIMISTYALPALQPQRR